MPTLKHGDVEMDWNDIPDVSRVALAQRGFTHIFGNERAATKTRLTEKRKSETELTELLAKWTADKFGQIVEGTLGVRVSSGLDAVARMMHTLAAKIIRDAMRAKKIEAPKGDAFEELVKKYVTKNERTLREKAETEIAARVALAKETADAADEILDGVL